MPTALEGLVAFETEAEKRGEWTAIQVLLSSDGSFTLWMARDALAAINIADALEMIARECLEQAKLMRPAGKA